MRMLATVFLTVGCTLENPCPTGTMRDGTSCLASLEDAAAIGRSAEPIEPGQGSDDDVRPADPDPGMDMVVPVEEPKVDDEPPASSVDAAGVEDLPDDAGPSDPNGDAERSPDAVVPNECPDDVRSAWRRFQLSADAVPTILACYADEPLCSTGTCDLAGCLRESAQVHGCDRCVVAEVKCSAERCSVPCSISTNDDACRACACANHCLDAPAGCGRSSVDACADCSGASCSARLASATDTITVPILFHLLRESLDPTPGVASYATGPGQHETMLDIDAALAQANAALEAVRPDARRLRFLRAGVAYLSAPAANVCPDPVATTDAQRLYGALNVVLTGATASCPAVATSAFAGRASSATLLRVLGNMLGIAPHDQQGEPWQITREQWLRMHNYARWRLGAGAAVPAAEKSTSAGLVHGPADPIWDKLTNRELALSNASVFDAVSAGPFSGGAVIESFSVAATSTARRVLGVRVSAKIRSAPSDDLRVVVSAPRENTEPVPRNSIWIGDGKLVAEDAFYMAGNLNTIGGRYPAGEWTVRIEDGADLNIEDLRLEIILGDRIFSSYDRHGRGVADILVYRPSTSELLTATNPGNGTLDFGAAVRDAVPPLPEADAKVISGDVNGDGWVDLLARRGAAIWVAFYERGFVTWRSGSIAGSDRPSAIDEVLMGDFDGDGFGDLMRRRANLEGWSVWAYHRGFGDGTFEAARAPDIPPHLGGAQYLADVSWTVADLRRSGRSDLLVRENQQFVAWIGYNITVRPTTSGATPVFFRGWNPTIANSWSAFFPTDEVISLDANHDGSGDLVARRPGSGEWFVHLNGGGNGEFFEDWQRLRIAGSTTAFEDTDVVLGAPP